MQRVRIGLTGLAFVFLAVLLATVFVRQPSMKPPSPEHNRAEQKGAVPAAPPPTEPAADPLATMKLAAGDSDVNAAVPQQSPPLRAAKSARAEMIEEIPRAITGWKNERGKDKRERRKIKDRSIPC